MTPESDYRDYTSEIRFAQPLAMAYNRKMSYGRETRLT